MTEHDLTRLTDRVIELLGITAEEIDVTVAGVHLLPPEIADSPARDAVIRARSVLSLALKKLGRDHGSWPADARAAVDALYGAAFPDDAAPAASEPAGGLSIRAEDLPESVAKRLQGLADQYPEELVALGSCNTALDLGIPNAEAVTFKWRFARILALTMEDRNLDARAVAKLAGEIEPAQIDRITKGLVSDVDSYEIMRLLKALGYRLIIDVRPPKEGLDGRCLGQRAGRLPLRRKVD